MNASSDASSQTIFESFMARVYGNPAAIQQVCRLLPASSVQYRCPCPSHGKAHTWQTHLRPGPWRVHGLKYAAKCAAQGSVRNAGPLPHSRTTAQNYLAQCARSCISLRSLRTAQERPATPPATEDVSVLPRANSDIARGIVWPLTVPAVWGVNGWLPLVAIWWTRAGRALRRSRHRNTASCVVEPVEAKLAWPFSKWINGSIEPRPPS
jgi:hypothetical protein